MEVLDEFHYGGRTKSKEHEHIHRIDVRRGHNMNRPEFLPQADQVDVDNQVFYRGE